MAAISILHDSEYYSRHPIFRLSQTNKVVVGVGEADAVEGGEKKLESVGSGGFQLPLSLSFPAISYLNHLHRLSQRCTSDADDHGEFNSIFHTSRLWRWLFDADQGFWFSSGLAFKSYPRKTLSLRIDLASGLCLHSAVPTLNHRKWKLLNLNSCYLTMHLEQWQCLGVFKTLSQWQNENDSRDGIHSNSCFVF